MIQRSRLKYLTIYSDLKISVNSKKLYFLFRSPDHKKKEAKENKENDYWKSSSNE